jgi:hypothetical protein
MHKHQHSSNLQYCRERFTLEDTAAIGLSVHPVPPLPTMATYEPV